MPDTKMKRYGFYIATALIVAVGMMILWPLGSEIFAGNSTPAGDLQDEVKRTHNQAQNLDESLTRMVPQPPPERQAAAQRAGAGAGPPETKAAQPQQAPQQPDGPAPTGQEPMLPPGMGDDSSGGIGSGAGSGSIGDGGSVGGGAGQEQVSTNPETRPTPDPAKYDEFANPTDQMTQEYLQWMEDMCVDLECPTGDQYVIAIQQLHAEWDQRYQEAVHAHKRFAWRINRAKTVAHEYFEIQSALTESMPNRQRREHYRNKDQEEREIFRVWQTQADEILSQSNIIMDELRQMNIELSKQVLSAQFASVYRDFEIIPVAITNLHYDLESFRIKSRELEARFGAAQQQ